MAKPAGTYTPMMAQFLSIKQQYPDVLLLYRMGDFYETFFDDAKIASQELELTLTSRDGGANGERIPMAGVPHHSLETYLPRLIAKGYRVAICEQMEDPAQAKGLVRREVVRLVTPGTLLESSMLHEKQNNFLAAVVPGDKAYGLAYCDISTGEFRVTQLPDAAAARQELDRLVVAECLVPVGPDQWLSAPNQRLDPATLPPDLADALPLGLMVTPRATHAFESTMTRRALLEQFGVQTLEGFGCEHLPMAARAAGAIINYLSETQRARLPLFSGLKTYEVTAHMVLDGQTRRNLELTNTSRDNSYKGSLLSVLDGTRTAMGGRRLRQWLLNPLLDPAEIGRRQDAIAELLAQPALLRGLADKLASVRDIERLAGRVAAGTANARDLNALKDSLLVLPHVAALVSACRSAPLKALSPASGELVAIATEIEATIADGPPIQTTEGNVIRQGFSPEVDALRSLMGDSKDWLTAFEVREKERSGIRSLKVGFSKTFGYFIEITHANRALVPPDYHRKQTLVNAERYITPELKERETAILQGEDKLFTLEHQLFTALRTKLGTLVPQLQHTGGLLADLDVLTSLAELAQQKRYVRPTVAQDTRLEILAGRHPVVEELLPSGRFVPNDTRMDTEDERLIILTGPNMAGKSTVMRQIALIAILAQMGSFVPAEHAHVGLVDRIFTRIGAVDDLSTGQSTFMVEMNETANILNNATERSLILLDEIGRGTSTLDGLSIAWSVSEHLAQHVRARTIFATHYHELTSLAATQPGVRNYRMLVEETEDDVVFLRRVVPGGADRSYGIEVARLAGLPPSVVGRAKQVLAALERNNKLASSLRKTLQTEVATGAQMSLFGTHVGPDDRRSSAGSDDGV
ncbi:MAG: mismatch repair protein MutS [Cyanobacteria bacterium RYN_339]|nr:mismatch repair protein MutS [Cyanobacteria bacterium RYN_339]